MKNRTPLDHARDLIARGLAPIPVPHGSKAPAMQGWPDLRLTVDDLPRYFNGAPGNVGTLLGESAGWIVDVDLDHARAVALADTFLPHTGMTWGRASKPRSHRLFRLTRPTDTRKWASKTAGMIVELRSTGCQTIAPGSTHPSGELVRWDDDGEPATIDPCALIAAIDAMVDKIRPVATVSTPIAQRPDDPKTQRPSDPIRSMAADAVVKRAAVAGRGQHDHRTMELARGLKINAGLSLADARDWFDRWWRDARPLCNLQDDDAAWFKFERAWETAAIPLDGKGPMAFALARVDALAPIPEERGFSNTLAKCVRALAEAGRLAGGQPFAVSAKQVAEALGVAIATAHEWLCGIARRGLIEVVDRGKPGANGTGRARRVRWVGGG